MSKFLSPFSFLLLSYNLAAQSPGGSACTDWGIEVCQSYLTQPSNIDNGPACPDGCFRVYYKVYLVKNGSGNLGEQNPITFTSLTLTGSLLVTPGNPGVVGKRLSKVNIPQTINCAPGFPGVNNPGTPNSPVISYDETTNLFSYEISATNYSLPNVTLTVPGKLLLFSLAVDVFPGEYVEIAGTSCSINLVNSNGSNTFCSAINVALGCGGGQFAKTIDQPSSGCVDPDAGPARFRIGAAVNAPTVGRPNRKKVPIWVEGTPNTKFNFEEFDFLLGITPTVGMMMPSIESGLISSASAQVYAIPGNNQYRIYTHAGSVQIKNTGSIGPENTLFYIVFDGPLLESECPQVDVDFRGSYGRIVGPNFDCCKPYFSSSQTIYWNGINGAPCVTQYCPEVIMKVAPSTTNGQQSTCNNMSGFDIRTTNSSASTPTHIVDFRCVLEVKKSGTFTLTPGSGGSASPYCYPFTCATLTEVSPTLLRIEVVINNINNLYVGANYGEKLIATISLSTSTGGCIQSIKFLNAVIRQDGATEECLTSAQSQITEASPLDDLCTGSLSISAETENGNAIVGWEYYLNRYTANNSDFPNCYQDGSTQGSSVVACPCQFNKTQNVALRKVDNPLNGVSTYDLVLISRHILGLTPLSGFKMLAADANTGGSITNFDVVELRKLILGIYSNLPSARSWRFIDKDLKSSILNSNNPYSFVGSLSDYFGTMNQQYTNYIPNTMGGAIYADEEFDEFALPTTGQLDNKVEFVGFKVGDVNGNALASASGQSETRSSQTVHFGTKGLTGKAGQRLEIPVFVTEPCALHAWQLALQYDTTVLSIKALKWPGELKKGVLQDRAWNIPHAGELRVLWFDVAAAQAFAPGTPLFYVEVELLRNQNRALNGIKIHSKSMQSEAYLPNGEAIALDLEISDLVPLVESKMQDIEEKPLVALSIYPNPTASVFRLNLETNTAVSTRLSIQDVLGKIWYEKSLDLAPGLTRIGSEMLPALPAGQYVISLYTPNGVQSLRLIRN